jgi:hypothetical protein
MLRKLLKKLSRKTASLYSIQLMMFLLLVAIILSWLFNFSNVPFSNPSLIKISGHDGFLDVMPYYSARDAFIILGRYGSQGRELYLKFLAVDFIFIPIYCLGFALLFTRIGRARFGENDSWLWLNLLPLTIGLFDCFENLCIMSMLFMYPVTNVALGTLSGIATLTKTALRFVSLLCLGYLGISLLFRQLTHLLKGQKKS